MDVAAALGSHWPGEPPDSLLALIDLGPDAWQRASDLVGAASPLGEGVVESGRVDLGAAGTLVAGLLGEGTDDGDPTACGQRQHTLVAQQHRPRGRGRPGQAMVLVAVARVLRAVASPPLPATAMGSAVVSTGAHAPEEQTPLGQAW